MALLKVVMLVIAEALVEVPDDVVFLLRTSLSLNLMGMELC